MPTNRLTTADIITDIIAKEGGATATHDPHDAGGRTQYGISERTHPEAWADGKVTEAEARDIYEAQYVKAPHFDQVSDPALRAQLVDFGVNSGPSVAIGKLQRVLGVAIDGILGVNTLKAITEADIQAVNNLLVAERVRMFARLTQRTPANLKFLVGWVERALSFLR